MWAKKGDSYRNGCKHIFCSKLPISKKVIIYGKGPTFDPAKTVCDAAIYCINQTAIKLMEIGRDPHVLICNDKEPYDDVVSYCNKINYKGRMIAALPCHPHINCTSVDICKICNKRRPHYESSLIPTYRFDLFSAKIRHFEYPIFNNIYTTFNTAIIIAQKFGAVDAYTVGIDGGAIRHKTFRTTHQSRDTSWQFAAHININLHRI